MEPSVDYLRTLIEKSDWPSEPDFKKSINAKQAVSEIKKSLKRLNDQVIVENDFESGTIQIVLSPDNDDVEAVNNLRDEIFHDRVVCKYMDLAKSFGFFVGWGKEDASLTNIKDSCLFIFTNNFD